MKYRFLPIILSLYFSGCAYHSGLHTYNLPSSGSYQTEAGVEVNVIPLTASTLPTTSSYQTHTQDVARLFNRDPLADYVLKPYDSLSVSFWGYPELNQPVTNNPQASGYQIDNRGYIHLPLVGRYLASGKTLSRINQDLQRAYSHYLKRPDVIVRVLSYESQPYSVHGHVATSGQFFLSNEPVSVYTALSLAGGITTEGDSRNIQLIRKGTTYNLNLVELEKSGYSLHNLLLQAHDTVYVAARESQKVYVMGEVGQNQAVNLRDEGMTLSDVIGEGLGLNPLSASSERVYVLRNERGRTDLYTIDLSNLGNFGLANQFAVKSNDIVYVDSTGLTRWQRVVSQILPFSSTLYNFNRM